MRALLPALMLIGLATAANAHPHVFVTSRTEIVYQTDGRLAGVRQIWTFDDMFSAFATQGLDANGDGKLTREELQPLAQTNVDSLKDFQYFTFAKLGGKQLLFKPPQDYWLDFTDKLLTLHFYLPLSSPQTQGKKPLSVEVYDPTYYVDFEMADKDPASISGGPACALNVVRPQQLTADQQAQALALDQADFSAANPTFGAQFANHILVNCP
ncbi:DUF1007 family protein [Labrys wisconsinensis]|uniref:ABC-type uncharacterized transport system substrate-binding protein n=1 Tax=Labrys wisconsinensis TaxID=425677 RepID=A0ABU0J8P2_9HYPH|nr:DUF1007 family protein [Labrys wisconsinensis]MDQ0470649.1 ABC-type uncharacterized transport system substrate-binding protein [Labrys wisconsinensis]